MPDTKISALTAASALGGTEAAPVVQGGVTVKATIAQVFTYVRSQTTDMLSSVIGGYRSRKLGLSGAQTLNTTTCRGGDTLIFTGAAATWTLPTRLASGDTAVTEAIVVHNDGAGAITLSASGVTLKGSTSIPAGASATLEWETRSGPTHNVWVRST